METVKSIWDLLEEDIPNTQHTRDLFSWSLNFDHDSRPFNLFLDIIGWSNEHIGSTLFDVAMSQRCLGYVEVDYLADAMKEWANHPYAVEEWINLAMSLEG
jgi:hypothetical protein